MSNSNRNLQTIINLFTNIISTIVSIGIGFFLSPYIVKHLGTEANGFAGLANNFVTYATLLTIALNSMASRFICIEYHKNNIEKAKKYYSSTMAGNIFIILLLIIPALLLVLNLQKVIDIKGASVIDVKILFSFVFLNFFINQSTSVFFISTYVKNKLFLQNIITMARTILNALLLIMLFGFFKPKLYFVSLVGLILSILSLPLSYIIKKRLIPEIYFERKSFDFKYVKTLISSGIWNTVNQCGHLLMTGFDLLITNVLINPTAMGILSIAKTIPNYIIQLGAMINTNFSPNLTISYAETSDKKLLLSQLRGAMKISSVVMSIPIVVFSVFGKPFYQLWMPSVDSNTLWALSILSCISFVPFGGPQILYNVFTTTNKLKVNSFSFIISGVLNIIIVYLLLKFTNLGIYAVAGVSQVISIIRNLCITVPYTAKLLELKWYTFYKDVATSIISCASVFAVAFIVKSIVPSHTWIWLIIAVGIACLLSLIVEFLLLLSKSEKEIFIEKLVKRGRTNG